jgi:hypothetical protein
MTSLDGRRLRDVTADPAGDVGRETVFEYHEEPGGMVWARYEGAMVRRGYLVGTREGDELDFRYVHLTAEGRTASGRCHSRIELLDDGRLRLHETWEWESQPGSGTSTLEEIPAARS